MSALSRVFALMVLALLLILLLRPPRPAMAPSQAAAPPPVAATIVTPINPAPRVTVYQRQQANGVTAFGDQRQGGQVRVVDHGRGTTFSGRFSGELPRSPSVRDDDQSTKIMPDPVEALKQSNQQQQKQLIELKARHLDRQIGD